MSDQIQQETWQVEVGGQIYEAAFNELPDWIAEGSLLPDDKVRKGNLRWIEAKKVPRLVPFFNAKESGEPMPVMVSVTESAPPPAASSEAVSVNVTPNAAPIPETIVSAAAVTEVVPPSAFKAPTPNVNIDFCKNHTDIPTVYVCDGCGGSFCKACPSSYGGSVKICPDCGQLCKPVEQMQSAVGRAAKDAGISGLDQNFGFVDLGNAIKHPFKYRTSLVVGGIMFTLFSIGQSAGAIGGIIMAAAALICAMLANMLTFGILANTVENFSQGRLSEDFMPSFDDFSLWGDMVHPFFLSIAAYLVSFGPFLITMILAVYMVMSSVATHVQTIQSDLEKIPGTEFYSNNRAVEQSEEIKKILAQAKERNAREQTMQAEGVTPPANAPVLDAETQAQNELWAEVQQMRQKQLEEALGSSEQAQQQMTQAMFAGILKLAAPFVVISGIFFLWGVLFFPAACLVAGYTRSFFATLNPLVGLDTIRRLGFDYIKILFMGFLLLVLLMAVMMVLSIIFMPFNMPRVGNIPATLVGSFIWFYVSIVFSCLLGYALFKARDRLKLPR
ncbi:MAG: hypothetical protein KF685_05480 [Acidobacteria bacterium]|nr:hypothetical protein [Acidobacteriota bacterium]